MGKNISISILIILNVLTLYRLLNRTGIPCTQINSVLEYERLNQIDTLVLSSWKKEERVTPKFDKPTILLFFSKKGCKSCYEDIIDLMSKYHNKQISTYIISTDVNTKEERSIFNARFIQALPFYSLKLLSLKDTSKYALPLFLVVDQKKQILFSKTLPPVPDALKEYPFWQRIELLYSLAKNAYS
ncbi:MAG: hypothetical protein V1799_01420 [bacterium]